MKPTYAENIVVAIKNSNQFEWYILDKDYCFLDYKKLEDAYRKKGFDVFIDDSSRFGIKIVNEHTVKSFLDNVKGFRVSAKDLKDMLMKESDYNGRLAYNPSLYIDFDNKQLISYYAEPESFEDFVPDGWTGEYREFENQIPENQKYWIN